MHSPSEARVIRPGALYTLYRDVWLHIAGQRHVFLAAVVLLISAQVVQLAIPYFSGRALNALQLHGTSGLHDAALLLAGGLALACGSWLLHGPGRVLERRAAIMIRERMSAALVERLFSLPLGWHDQHHSGATAHRVQQSSQALSAFAQSQYIYLNSAVRLIGPLAALCCIRPLVGTIAIAGFATIVGSVVGFDRAMLRLANLENDAERHYAATLVDTLGNAGTVYALRQSRGATLRIQQRLLAVFKPLRQAIVLNELKWMTVDLFTRLLSCCLVGVFVWRVTRGASDTATEQALLLGSLYMVWEYAQQSSSVICSIASHFQTFARQHADYESASLIREAKPRAEPMGPQACNRSWQRMTVHDLSFRHSSGQGCADLEGVALTLERGKRYALIGASGSGKSTLMRTLAGLYLAERVAITLDRQPTRISSADAAGLLRNTTTLIPQDAQLYEGTVSENLALCESLDGKPQPSDYLGALQTACATDFVESTPLGLESPVAERGANLSGGQRSRLGLARGVLAARGSSIVLLDEPTANLDPATEERVLTGLFATFDTACLITSIHRLSLLSYFDQVLIMQQGRLIAQGSPDELTLSCSEFQRLTRSTRFEFADQSIQRASSTKL